MAERVPLNDLSRLTSSEIERLTATLQNVVSSGHYLKGHFTRTFEDQLSRRLNGQSVLGVANGTDALILAMETIKQMKSVGSIAVAPNAGGYSSIAAIRSGWTPVCVDVDETTAQMDSVALREVLTTNKSIKAVVVTHLYGYVGNIGEIAQICRNNDVVLIEDCAQAFGAKVDTRSVGTFGDIATFSFYPTKNLGALGDAGAISFRSKDFFECATRLSQYGWSSRYRIDVPNGFNSRIDEMQAAVLAIQLEKIDDDNATRRRIVGRYSRCLNGKRSMIYKEDPSFVGHLAIMKTQYRDADIAVLAKQGVETGIHYPVLDVEQPAWLNVFSRQPELPAALRLNQQIVTLPCFPTMSEDEIVTVEAALMELSRESH